MKKLLLLTVLFFAAMPLLRAGGGEDSTRLFLEQFQNYIRLQDSVNKAMKYQTGVVALPAGVVQLNVPKGFKYLNEEQSRYVIEKLWGNLPQGNLQGMLFPENDDPFTDSSYAYIITYNEMGYVKDGDAKDINYDDLLKQMKDDDASDNAQRKAAGLSQLYTEGWAATPFYDDQKKVLHWALDLRVEGMEEHTLNYKIISLGRKGILTMNAIATTAELGMVKADVDKVLNMTEFTTGNRYQDFDSKVDNVAAWTVGGLVAGKILLKTAAGAGILKFLKFIIIGIVAAGGAIWRWITGRKKKEEEFVYQPAPVQEQPDETTPQQT